MLHTVGARKELNRLRKAAGRGDTTAMVTLASLLEDRGDLEGAESWYRKAAEAGEADALRWVGLVRHPEGDIDAGKAPHHGASRVGTAVVMNSGGGNMYASFNSGVSLQGEVGLYEAGRVREAAERGDGVAMHALGILAHKKGDLGEAKAWYRRGAEHGDAPSMNNLGWMLFENGDLDEAEGWYRRAVEGGHTGALDNLALLLERRGDLDEADSLYRRAAATGMIASMNNLGVLLAGRGDVEGAEEWYRRAIEGGDRSASYNLARLLQRTGDLVGAEAWLRHAAEGGSAFAMHDLGSLLKDKGEFHEAEVWFRRAAEQGNSYGLTGLGWLSERSGDLAAAEQWYQQALRAGLEAAGPLLARVRGRTRAETQLDLLTFDTFGWELSRHGGGFRRWGTDVDFLTEAFLDLPPDLESLNPHRIRKDIQSTLDLVGSQTLDPPGLDLPDQVSWLVEAADLGRITVLDVECFEVGPAKCILHVFRRFRAAGAAYVAGIMVLFAECCWVLSIELGEGSEIGKREGEVARHVMEGLESPSGAELDPYDGRWDGIVALEDDPLTRTRLLADRLRDSIQLSGRVAELAPFVPKE
jgi:TPR repeat protein